MIRYCTEYCRVSINSIELLAPKGYNWRDLEREKSGLVSVMSYLCWKGIYSIDMIVRKRGEKENFCHP